jgi:hypothetical protein
MARKPSPISKLNKSVPWSFETPLNSLDSQFPRTGLGGELEPTVRGELVIGWSAHYGIGVSFATLLLAVWGLDWARHPTLVAPLIVGVGTVVAPFFIMQPGRGSELRHRAIATSC